MVLRLGVLGGGRIGRIHCENALSLRDHVSLVAVCDPKLDHAWASEHRIAHRLEDEDQLWRLDLDAVIIASPTNQHKRQVLAAIKHRRHILCEKPLDLSVDEHLIIEQALSQSTVKLQIGFNRRFDDDFMKIANLVRQGDLGKAYFLRITSRDPHLPSLDYLRSSGGMLLDMSIHDFDMARFIMNSEVEEVFARGANLIDPTLKEINDIDTAVISLKFKNGAFGIIDNSRQAVYGYDQRVEFFGSLGSASNQNHRLSSVEYSGSEGLSLGPSVNFFLERYRDSYRRELLAFIKTCKSDESPRPDIDDAIFAVKIALMAKQSIMTKQAVRL